LIKCFPLKILARVLAQRKTEKISEEITRSRYARTSFGHFSALLLQMAERSRGNRRLRTSDAEAARNRPKSYGTPCTPGRGQSRSFDRRMRCGDVVVVVVVVELAASQFLRR